MNSQRQHANDNSSSNLICCSILDWDQPLTDQELEAIDAIEASFQIRPTTATPSSSSLIKERPSSPQQNEQKDNHKSRRQLPASLFKPVSLSPYQGSVKMRYPEMKFGGRILYSRTAVEVERAARELLQSVRAKKQELGQVIFGFDIEWKPTFQKGVLPGKTAVMQICRDTNLCHVMHIFHSGITQSLQLLLEDPTLVKVGLGIGNDCVKVFRDYNVSVKSVEDLSYMANQKLGGEPKVWGLQELTEMLVCKELRKPNKIRLGNWEIDVLSSAQLQYAATDAFASWQLYQALKTLPDRKEDASERSAALKAEST